MTSASSGVIARRSGILSPGWRLPGDPRRPPAGIAPQTLDAVGSTRLSAIPNSLRHENVWLAEPIRVWEHADNRKADLTIKLERMVS
jgi:hypothetical protein